jgi:hypothetical protein
MPSSSARYAASCSPRRGSPPRPPARRSTARCRSPVARRVPRRARCQTAAPRRRGGGGRRGRRPACQGAARHRLQAGEQRGVRPGPGGHGAEAGGNGGEAGGHGVPASPGSGPCSGCFSWTAPWSRCTSWARSTRVEALLRWVASRPSPPQVDGRALVDLSLGSALLSIDFASLPGAKVETVAILASAVERAVTTGHRKEGLHLGPAGDEGPHPRRAGGPWRRAGPGPPWQGKAPGSRPRQRGRGRAGGCP